MVSATMDHRKTVDRIKGTLCEGFLIFTIWLSTLEDVASLKVLVEQKQLLSHHEYITSPSTGLFEPIQISPSVIPRYPIPAQSSPPLYPSFPQTYDPVLTGNCPVNFTTISSIMEKTAADCSQPLAPLVGNVICCPQFASLLQIFQGYYSTSSNKLVLVDDVANDCFSDIISILAGKGANSTLPALCSAKPSNLTGGSCPTKDLSSFERFVNTSQLLDACSVVDPLKECCRPVCQPAVADAALQLLARGKNMIGDLDIDVLNDCKGVVHSWLSKKLSADAANTAFRILLSCKVNRACPLEFKHPSEVVKACRNRAAPNLSCCSSVNSYISGIQKQMLITNKQAIICATMFGTTLQKSGVMTNIYGLCDVDLKDFTIQATAYGQQGCLLRSLPADVVYDNASGYSFTCDLNDNIGAPWPSSSSMASMPLCAPEMSLPALPKSKHSGSSDRQAVGWKFIVTIYSIFVTINTLMY